MFGEWNTANLGDRAIFVGIKNFLEDAGWDMLPMAFGSMLSVERLDAHRVDLGTSAERFALLSQVRRRAKPVLRPLRQAIRARRALEDIRHAKVLILGGGALLSDLNMHFMHSLSRLTWLAKRSRLPILCLGCSVEGKWSGQARRIVSEFCNECVFVAARDVNSAKLLSDLLQRNIQVIGDFALYGSDGSKRNEHLASPAGSNLAVNVMRLPGSWSELQRQYEQGIVEVAVAWLREQKSAGADARVTVFTTGTFEDVTPAERVSNAIGHKDVALKFPGDLDDLIALLRKVDFVIASRLHSAILSIREGVPVLGFSPTPKIGYFFETVGIADRAVSPLAPDAVSRVLRLLKNRNDFDAMLNLSRFDEARNRTLEILGRLSGDNG